MLRQRSATRRQTNQVRPDALISSEDLLVIKDTACAVNCQKKVVSCALQMCYASCTTQCIITQSLAALEWQPSSSG